MSPKKMVYSFADGKAEGDAKMRNLLGGKGANLAEMVLIGIPVPAGFTITTEVCVHYYENGRKWPTGLEKEIDQALAKVERAMGKKFGDPKKPLLVSVRSGARASMPGMMETILNAGLTSKTIEGVIKASGNARFAYDSWRRLMMMYSDVVMEKAAGIEPKDGQGIRVQLEHIMEELKHAKGYKIDTDMNVDDLKYLCDEFRKRIKAVLGKEFPDDARTQLHGAINAVFASWMGKRAIHYRRIEGIPDNWGTAVNVQAMVFGNMGDNSATGVAFTRDPSTGENAFYGEWLVNAQGEDVVAGIRTPSPMSEQHKTPEQKAAGVVSLEKGNPKAFKALDAIRKKLEKHYKDMQDIEFTIEEGRLWMLQCRSGKRNGTAAVRVAVEMLRERLIDADTAITRVKPSQLDELLHPSVDPAAERANHPIAKGLPAGPGGACGMIAFSPDKAEEWAKQGKKVILTRIETSPEDVAGMHAAAGILTSRGGMTSHAALVARGWGKCCIVGCGDLRIDYAAKTLAAGDVVLKEGDYITLNGTAGRVFAGQLNLLPADPEKNPYYKELMKVADKRRVIAVRTNADNGTDAARARSFGAQGIGLCRTEHMFFGEGRIAAIRELIVASRNRDKAKAVAGRRKAVAKLLPYQKQDFIEIFGAMDGLPVTIRLIDPPLHEFAPNEAQQIEELSHQVGMTVKELEQLIHELHELNPMLGHRGCRLGISIPELTEMQSRAIFEAVAELRKKKVKVLPEVMIPLVGHVNELKDQAAIVHRVAGEVMKAYKTKFDYMVGTMIELPRAALTADQIAGDAEFFSFGTNDLTQTTFGFSRDDIGTFLPEYLERNILPVDPFQSLDQEGVGILMKMGIEKGRAVRDGLKVGICGEHGGDPSSVEFCHRLGMNYVSCSPFRVPIARLAAAHAAIKYQHGELTAAAAPAKKTKAKAGKAKKAGKGKKAK